MNHYQPVSDTGDGENDVLNEESKEYLIKIKELEAKLNDTMSEKDEMAQRCHELDMQVIIVLGIYLLLPLTYQSQIRVIDDMI